MFNLLDLQQQRAHKVLTVKDLVEKAEKAETGARPMTPDECAIFDRLTEEIGKLDENIAAVQAHQRRADAGRKLLEDLDKPGGRIVPPDQPTAKGTDGATANGADLRLNFRVPATARPVARLKAFKTRKGESDHDAEKRAYRSGMWVLATLFRNDRAQHWCTTHGGLDIRAAMSTFSNPDGGFVVEDEMTRTIIDLREEFGVFRQNARVWPMNSDTLLIPRRTGGVTWGPIGEGQTITDSNPTGDTVMLVAKKVGGLVKLSSEINEDSVIDLADWIAREMAWGSSQFEDQAAFIGDGTSTYHGIRGLTNLLTTASGLAGAVAAASGHDTFAEIDATDIAKVMGAIPAFARANAKFYASQMAAEMIFGRLQANAGGNTVGTLSGERAARSYLGHEIVISQVLPTSTGTINGTAMFFFGDLSRSSALGDRRQLRVMASEHRYFETDQIGIKGTARLDIVHHDIGTTATAGPVVGMMGTT